MLIWLVFAAVFVGQIINDFRLRQAERALKSMLQSQLKQGASVAGLEAGAIISGQDVRRLLLHCCDACRNKL